MIKVTPAENDDADFLALVQRIINGVLVKLGIQEVFLVHIDNWFDHKWLGWWSRKEEELRAPTFTPNRVLSEKHFLWRSANSTWESSDVKKPLHIRQPGRPWLAQPLDRFSEHAAFIWFSGNSVQDKVGSLMVYVSGAEGYSWYASFEKTDQWVIKDELKTTRRELIIFETCGRQLELALT